MLREAIALGDTIELAFKKACEQLGVDTASAEIEVLETPTKKTFGLFGGNPAKVRAYIKEEVPAQKAVEYLKKILAHLGHTDVKITVNDEEAGALLVVEGENLGNIIGHRGETLDAIQYITSLVANQAQKEYFRITLDVGNYREKRKATLQNLAKNISGKALRTSRNCSLEPMNPYERRIIHTVVQEIEGVKSWSEGNDLYRHVVIGPIDGERYQRRGGSRKSSGGYQKKNNSKDRGAPKPFIPRTPLEGAKNDDDLTTPIYGKIEFKKDE